MVFNNEYYFKVSVTLRKWKFFKIKFFNLQVETDSCMNIIHKYIIKKIEIKSIVLTQNWAHHGIRRVLLLKLAVCTRHHKTTVYFFANPLTNTPLILTYISSAHTSSRVQRRKAEVEVWLLAQSWQEPFSSGRCVSCKQFDVHRLLRMTPMEVGNRIHIQDGQASIREHSLGRY